MRELLQHMLLDNSLGSYLTIVLVVGCMLLLKGVISRFFCTLLYRLVPQTKRFISREQFIALVLSPMEWFVVWTVIVFSLHNLRFPEALRFELYKLSTQEIADAVGKAVLIVLFIRLLIRLIDFLATILEVRANETPDQGDNQLVVFFKDFFKVIAGIIGVLLVARYVFNFNIANLITGLSIVTAAIALATRESLENLIASFIIFFDRPFTVGDLVKVEAITGTVERIGLRSTRIRTDQKTFVTVPNKKMVDSILDNLSLRTQRKAEIKLELSVATAPEKIETLLQQAGRLLQETKGAEQSTVVLTDIGFQSITITAEYFTDPIPFADYQQLKQEVSLRLLQLVAALQIEMAGVNATQP